MKTVISLSAVMLTYNFICQCALLTQDEVANVMKMFCQSMNFYPGLIPQIWVPKLEVGKWKIKHSIDFVTDTVVKKHCESETKSWCRIQPGINWQKILIFMQILCHKLHISSKEGRVVLCHKKTGGGSTDF